MSKLFERLNSKKEKDLRVIADFVFVFCRENHPDSGKSIFPVKDERLHFIFNGKDTALCPDCQKLLSHGIAKRLQCTYDPKPMCKSAKLIVTRRATGTRCWK